MICVLGNWFDGKTSAQINAILKVYDSGAVRIECSDDGRLLFSQTQFSAKISDRLANTPRFLDFDGNGTFETKDNPKIDELLKQIQHRSWMTWVHALESRKRYVLIAAIVVIAFVTAILKYGAPAAAKLIAANLPYSVFEMAGRQTLATLDKVLFEPSKLDLQKQNEMLNHFQSIIKTHDTMHLKVVFRQGGRIGPNAFALPCGTIIFTDELVELAGHYDELTAILAHEIGHVVHQHGMRRVIQDSLLTFTILAITGDASGVSELFLGLPVALTELAYSREFERQADSYALNYLQTHNISTQRFADILNRIEKRDKKKTSTDSSQWTSYLSTHPPTVERIKRFQDSENER